MKQSRATWIVIAAVLLLAVPSAEARWPGGAIISQQGRESQPRQSLPRVAQKRTPVWATNPARLRAAFGPGSRPASVGARMSAALRSISTRWRSPRQPAFVPVDSEGRPVTSSKANRTMGCCSACGPGGMARRLARSLSSSSDGSARGLPRVESGSIRILSDSSYRLVD